MKTDFWVMINKQHWAEQDSLALNSVTDPFLSHHLPTRQGTQARVGEQVVKEFNTVGVYHSDYDQH